jgi:hypothetical protein
MTATARRSVQAPHQLRRAFALLGAPTAWFVHLSVAYALVPDACRSGWGEAATATSTVVALAVAAAGGVVAHRLASQAVDPHREKELDVILGGVGLLIAVLFSLVIVGIGAAALSVGPCGA